MSLVGLYPPMRGLANLPWPTLLAGLRLSSSSQLNNSTNLTASATIHTKGAWAQVIASTADPVSALMVNMGGVSVLNTETSTLLDLATGASGSEVVFAENIAVGGALTASPYNSNVIISLPVRIPSGTRIAARIQGLRASQTANISVNILTGSASHLLPTTLDVIGTSTATSRGTVMSGASGTYVEMIASTTRRYRALCIVPSLPTNNVTTERLITYTAGVGAAGSEVALGDFVARYETIERVSCLPALPPLPIACDVPAGSRLAVRHNAPNNPGEFACCLIGVP